MTRSIRLKLGSDELGFVRRGSSSEKGGRKLNLIDNRSARLGRSTGGKERTQSATAETESIPIEKRRGEDRSVIYGDSLFSADARSE